MQMVGAGVLDPAFVFDSCMNGSSPSSESFNVLALGVAIGFVPRGGCFCWQTVLRWPILPHLRHVYPLARQFFLPSSWFLPHQKHALCLWVGPLGGQLRIALTSGMPWMSEWDLLAASNPRHLVMACSSESFFSCR